MSSTVKDRTNLKIKEKYLSPAESTTKGLAVSRSNSSLSLYSSASAPTSPMTRKASNELHIIVTKCLSFLCYIEWSRKGLGFFFFFLDEQVLLWNIINILTSVMFLDLGIASQELLRWPMHPPQEFHSSSGVWSSVCSNGGGQLPLTLRSGNLLCIAFCNFKFLDDVQLCSCFQMKLRSCPHDYLCFWAHCVTGSAQPKHSLWASKEWN